MLKKICSFTVLSLISISSILTGAEYDIQDIGTLQTRSSEALAINSKGQLLGWYNIDNTPAGKHIFLREKDGTFIELPTTEKGGGTEITWKYLTDNGNVYGSYHNNAAVLCMWEQKNGVVKLGTLPGNQIAHINNAGQVLITSVPDTENGKSIKRPMIWENGKVTKLSGLEGDTGIPSEESYGFSINNKGEVVGKSVIYLTYKNQTYKQVHATKWVNGKAIDLYDKIPKSINSTALFINDLGDIFLMNSENSTGYILRYNEISAIEYGSSGNTKIDNSGNIYTENYICSKSSMGILALSNLNSSLEKDYGSIWKKITKIIHVNDKGEIIAEGVTIYDEKHAVLLSPIPVKPKEVKAG